MTIPEAVKGFLLNQFNTFAKTSIRKILDETGIPSRKLAVETIEFPFDLTLKLAEELNLSICFDTGHVLAGFSGPIDFIKTLDRCIPRLAEIHLHDSPEHSNIISNPQGKDHQPLGKGDLNLDLLFSRLEEVRFTGPIIFELPLDQALDSLNLIQQKRPNLDHSFKY
jgi:sugar phosphate isomerase/epimerase